MTAADHEEIAGVYAQEVLRYCDTPPGRRVFRGEALAWPEEFDWEVFQSQAVENAADKSPASAPDLFGRDGDLLAFVSG